MRPSRRWNTSTSRYILHRFPVVATYLGGDAFDPHLAKVDGTLRDYSPEGLAREDAHLVGLRARFAALAPATLPARRRIDRSVALAQIAFLLHQHQVRHYQERALDSYVDEPFRGVDWQIQGMTATGPGTYGTQLEWQEVIARTRAVPAYLAIAEKQLAAGVRAHNTPDWRVLSQYRPAEQRRGRRLFHEDAAADRRHGYQRTRA